MDSLNRDPTAVPEISPRGCCGIRFSFRFKEVIKKGNAMSVMASYNEIDGIPSHANRWLLRDVLRGEWGFEGFVVSDYYAITELNGKADSVSHSVAANKTEAAILSINAGVNIELPDPDCYPNIVQACAGRACCRICD